MTVSKMKIKTKDAKLKGFELNVIVSHLSVCTFCFLLLAFCFLASVSFAETFSGQLDPTNLLAGHLAKSLQDTNMPNAPVYPIQPPAVLSQLQTSSNSAGTATVSFAAQVSKKLPQNTFIITADQNSILKDQLWQARISLPTAKNDNESKNELKQIIEQLRSVEFKPKKKTREPVIIVEPTLSPTDTTGEPSENLSGSLLETNHKKQTPLDTALLKKAEQKEIQSKLSYEPITKQTLQMLKDISQHPDQVHNPFELAEVLFLSGQLKEAGIFYQEALNRINPNESVSAEDRAWILLQIGNCLRDDDLQAAKQKYRQLITEYPDSSWTDFAKTQEKLIDWYQKDKPQTFISETVSQ